MKKLVLIAAMAALSLNLALWGQSITVTSPTAASDWCKGNTYSITWTKSGAMQATAAIRLRAAGSSESDPAILAIADGTANDGSYSWTIPGTVAPGNYFIRVRTDDSTVIGDSPVFEIMNCAAASITVTSPTAASSWCKGNTYSITWTKSGSMQATAAIRLRAAGSSESDPATLAIADGTANNGSYSWTIPGTVAPGNYFIRVRTDDSTVSDDSPNFEIKACATGPSITVTKPHGGTWFKKMKYDITWDKTGIMPDHVKISLRNAFWMPGHPAVDILVIAADTPNDGSFSWIIPNSVANGTYVIRVTTIGPDPDISDTSTSFKIAPGFILPPHEWVVREPWFHFPDPDPCLCPEFNIREFLEDIIHGVGPQFDGSIFLLKNGLKLQELGAFGEGKVLPDKVKAKLSPENFAALKNHTAKFSLGVFDANGQLVKEVEVQGAQQAELR